MFRATKYLVHLAVMVRYGIANNAILCQFLLSQTYCTEYILITFIALMMEAVRICLTSVYSNKATQRYIPEGSHLIIL
jgi:hypothetical protein